MENMVLLIICISLIFVMIGIVLLGRKRNKELSQKGQLITQLNKRIERLNEQVQRKERREAFRINVKIHCKFQLLKIGDQSFDLLNDTSETGNIKDISFSGLQLETDYDIDMKDVVQLLIQFEMENRNLRLKGLIVRKESRIENPNIIYGIRFIENDMNVQSELNRIIRVKEIERQKQTRIQKVEG